MEIKCQLDLGKVDHKNGMEIPFWKPNNKTTLIGPEIYTRHQQLVRQSEKGKMG